MNNLENTGFRLCRKTAKTVARLLTVDDLVERGGVIQTNEGAKPFVVGDFVAKDALGEYPIPLPTMLQRKRRVSEPDADGWAEYETTDVVEAKQIDEPFEARGLHGEPGYYLVRSIGGGNERPVEPGIFESTYTWVQ